MRLLLFCAFSLTLSGADVSGIWNGQITDRNGDMQDVSFRFVQSGATLTGKMYGDNESIPIAEAKIDGDRITFAVTTELNGSVAKSIYTGIIDGDELTLKRRRADAKDQQSIKLKRVA